MAYFALSGITGCISPASGGTSDAYSVMYNDAFITTYYKKDITTPAFVSIYMVCVVFETRIQQFHFLTTTDRDNFYDTLPV